MIVEIDDLYICRLLASCGAIFVWLSISSGAYSAWILDGSVIWVYGRVCEAVSVLSVMIGFDMVSRLSVFHCFAGWFIWQQKGFTQIFYFVSKPVLQESWSLSRDAFIKTRCFMCLKMPTVSASLIKYRWPLLFLKTSLASEWWSSWNVIITTPLF